VFLVILFKAHRIKSGQCWTEGSSSSLYPQQTFSTRDRSHGEETSRSEHSPLYNSSLILDRRTIGRVRKVDTNKSDTSLDFRLSRNQKDQAIIRSAEGKAHAGGYRWEKRGGGEREAQCSEYWLLRQWAQMDRHRYISLEP
jgi:hypothetical protein